MIKMLKHLLFKFSCLYAHKFGVLKSVLMRLFARVGNRGYLHLDFANLKRFSSTQYPDQLNVEDLINSALMQSHQPFFKSLSLSSQ
jgi:hypothetical protein